VIQSYTARIIPDDYNYYASMDTELKTLYNSYAKQWYDFFVTLDKFIADRNNDDLKKDLIAGYADIQNILKADHSLEKRYVQIKNSGAYDLYFPLPEDLKTRFKKIEPVFIGKFDELLTTETITQSEYEQALSAYNDFVLHFTLFATYRNSEAKQATIAALRELAPTYRKKVKKVVVAPVQNPPPNLPPIKGEEQKVEVETSVPVKTYGDVYYFDFELKKGDYHVDVSHLQKILLREGYFDHAITYYYGEVTTAALKNYAKQELGLDVSGEVFDAELIEKILEREMK
ncbi:peptidoglycan-binding protein, partial [Candidatus Gracilibacteria bacterium]|nr:peptidoglycan-binding protein [Candidatus Gracilibacteria bacterium]